MHKVWLIIFKKGKLKTRCFSMQFRWTKKIEWLTFFGGMVGQGLIATFWWCSVLLQLLCLWHISKNAAIQLRSHYGHPVFKSRFNKILYGCETEAEFNSCWDGLIRDYNLAGDKWLKSWYEIREKWCPVFSVNIFFCQMKVSSRSESTNNVFHNMTSKTMSLTECVLHYETAGKKKREASVYTAGNSTACNIYIYSQNILLIWTWVCFYLGGQNRRS